MVGVQLVVMAVIVGVILVMEQGVVEVEATAPQLVEGEAKVDNAVVVEGVPMTRRSREQGRQRLLWR